MIDNEIVWIRIHKNQLFEYDCFNRLFKWIEVNDLVRLG